MGGKEDPLAVKEETEETKEDEKPGEAVLEDAKELTEVETPAESSEKETKDA
jgi:hypothetical protein